MNKKAVAAGLVAGSIFLAGAAGWWWLDKAAGAASGTVPAEAGRLPVPVVDAEGLSGFDERERAIILQLRKKYGARIAGVALQVQVLTHLRDLLQKLYPQDWEARLARILAAAFPQQAAELLERYALLERYEAWLQDSLPQLQFENAEARRQAVWDKRFELFGEAAYEIWAVELRERRLAQTLQQLATSTAPFAEKSKTYIDQLRATYGENITGANAPHLTQNMTRFLELPGVQNDLRNVAPEERRQRLREFRRAMGLDDAALERWGALDAERDTMRQSGDVYMAERARLEARYQGAELQAQVQALQDRLFGAEATFIRNEEATGHFRYKRPQTLGVN